MAFQVDKHEAGSVIILEIAGDLDSRAAPEFEDAMLSSAETADARILVDFARLGFVSSAGLRVLIMVGRRLKAGTGALALCSLNPDVKEVLDIAGMMRQFAVYADRESAVAWFEASGGVTRVARLAEDLLQRGEKNRLASALRRRSSRPAERIELALELLGSSD